jgi:hypothetical protein
VRTTTKSARVAWTTAYHEAGHAVAAFFLGLRIGRAGITIVPNKKEGAAGTAHIPPDLKDNPEYLTLPRTYLRIENFAVMCLAGDRAQRKFAPRSRSRLSC